MDMKQCKEIFKLSTTDTKAAVRKFVTTTKATGTDIVPTFVKRFPELADNLRDIDSRYKQRIGQQRPRIIYTHIIALACGSLPKCKGCGAPHIKMFPRHPGGGMPDYCSHECLNTSEHAWDKRRQTTLDRYGSTNYFGSKKFAKELPQRLEAKYDLKVTNISQIPEVQKKKIQTAMVKRGVSHHMKDPAFIRKQQKQGRFTSSSYSGMRGKAMLAYEQANGYANPLSNPLVMAKVKATSISKYGFDNPAKSLRVKQKISTSNSSESVQEKYRSTSKDNWGTDYPNQSATGQRTTRVRYQIIECLGHQLAVEGSEKVVAEALEAKGKFIKIRRGDELGIEIPYQSVTGRTKVYHPDFVVKSTKGVVYIIEPKVERTLWSEGFLGGDGFRKMQALVKFCEDHNAKPILAMVSRQGRVSQHIEWIKDPVSWIQKTVTQKLEHALSSTPELAPSLRLSRTDAPE